MTRTFTRKAYNTDLTDPEWTLVHQELPPAPDRNAQLEHFNTQVVTFARQRQPVISVDTKKKELVGDLKNGSREWQPQGQPENLCVHDFIGKELGKVIPDGISDPASNEGWVSVGITHDTAQFAVASIRRWWTEMGVGRFPKARKRMITADGGGSNSSRNRLWKVTLQELADELELARTAPDESANHRRTDRQHHDRRRPDSPRRPRRKRKRNGNQNH